MDETTTVPDVDPDETPSETTPEYSGITPLGAQIMADSTAPETTLGFSYEYGVDVKIDDAWQPIRFASNINPVTTKKEIDAATYDDQGDDHPVVVGETTQLDLFVQQHRLSDGTYMPEVEALLAAFKDGTAVPIRWYDKPKTGTPNPDDAWQAEATVTGMPRAQVGNAEVGGWNVSLKTQGPRTQIDNPAASTGA